jgi:hypothetical protein
MASGINKGGSFMATLQVQEVRMTQTRIQPITATANIKPPKTTWDYNENAGEVEQITTITLVVKDMAKRDLERLARVAGVKGLTMQMDLTPSFEQTEFSINADDNETD